MAATATVAPTPNTTMRALRGDRSPAEFAVVIRRAAREIGAQLFLSPRTVEWHLTKMFGKLGISSRKELGSALSDINGNGASS